MLQVPAALAHARQGPIPELVRVPVMEQIGPGLDDGCEMILRWAGMPGRLRLVER